MAVPSRSRTTTFLCVEDGVLLFTGRNPFRGGCCYAAQSYVILTRFFVNLLVLKGLESELPPIDRQTADPKVGLRNSPSHSYQPDLRILTRSTSSPPPRDLARRRFLRPCPSDTKFDPTDDGGRLSGGFVHPGLHRLPPRQTPGASLGVRSKGLLGPGCPARGTRPAWCGFLPAGDPYLHHLRGRPLALGARHFSERHYFPERLFHRAGSIGSGNPAILPHLCASCRSAYFPQSCVHTVFLRHHVPAY